MILWILVLGFFILASYIFRAMMDEDGRIDSGIIMLIMGVTIFAGIIYPAAASAISSYERTEEDILNNINIPLCDGSINHYEYQLNWFSENEHYIIKKYNMMGWSDIKMIDRTSGGLFGGTSTYITGECVISR